MMFESVLMFVIVLVLVLVLSLALNSCGGFGFVEHPFFNDVFRDWKG